MATQILSPGVFVEDHDQSYISQGISSIGGAVIGPTLKGPAMEPVTCSTWSEFVQIFGDTQGTTYVPYMAKEYLRQGGTLTVIRTLHDDQYKCKNLAALSAKVNDSYTSSYTKTIYSASGDNTTSQAGITYYDTITKQPVTITYENTSSSVSSSTEITTDTYTFQPSSSVSASITTYWGIVTQQQTKTLVNNDYKTIAYFHPGQIIVENDNYYTAVSGGYAGTTCSIVDATSGMFTITFQGDFDTDQDTYGSRAKQANTTSPLTFTCSLNNVDDRALNKQFSRIPTSTTNPIYTPVLFDTAINNIYALIVEGYGLKDVKITLGEYDSYDTYSEAITPWIIAQTSTTTDSVPLFRFHTLADGLYSNYEVKVAISNIKAAGTVAGSDYGSFTVQLRANDQTKLQTLGSPYSYNDTDMRPYVLETYTDVNLDPNSANYIGRLIGDSYSTFANGKITHHGNYSNKSSYVYVEIDDNVENNINSPELVPFGFESLYCPVPSDIANTLPSASYVTDQLVNGSYNKRKCYGFNFDFTNSDNINYLCALPSDSTKSKGKNTNFLLSTITENADASNVTTTHTIDLTSQTNINSRNFIVPFQGGFDGVQPNRRCAMGKDISATNTMGYNLKNSSAKDYSVYTNALDILSNTDEFDINMLVLPGVFQDVHSSIIDYAANMCIDRGDTFFVYDATTLTKSIADIISIVSTIDNNFAATYYPWVKIMDANTNKPLWVPPSVVIPGVLAFNDRVAAEWYAPAGLNRGGLSQVIDTYTRLTQGERDTLYENRINPIANFPGQGPTCWGQKTLQAKPSALDRINVRRLLIKVEKYIASTSRYLIFEQNTTQLQKQFVNMVTPYLDGIKQQNGINDFRVLCDSTNNTPDITERNILYCQLWIKPTLTAEFIKLNFTITKQDATFSEQ
jgi:phage tail sheath protein FI